MPITSISFAIDNLDLPDYISAFSTAYGWTATIPDPANPGQTIPNPVTQNQFARQHIIGEWQQAIKDCKTAKAQAQIVIGTTNIT